MRKIQINDSEKFKQIKLSIVIQTLKLSHQQCSCLNCCPEGMVL